MERLNDDEYEYEDTSLSIGSLHALNDFEPDEEPDNGPKVRMGFHPPEKSWIKQPE